MRHDEPLADGQQTRVSWPLVCGLVVLGSALIIPGFALNEGYLRDCLLGIGTGIFLVAFIYFAEQRLMKVVEQVAGPSTLSEAQRDLGDLLRSARQRGGGGQPPAGLEQARREAVRRVLRQLGAAGLRQQPLASDATSTVLADEAGVGLEWEVIWDDRAVRHRVRLPMTRWHDGVDLSPRPRALSAGPNLTPNDQRQLNEFEHDVFVHMRQVVLALTRAS